MDKLNKTFEPQQVLEAQDMTDVVGKVNELIESVNIYDNLDALAFQAQEATTEAKEAATNANREAEAAQTITATVTEESKKIAQLNTTIEQQETSRAQQESVREANEKTRQSQEEARQANFSSATNKAETAAQTANEAAKRAETATQQITSGENGRVTAEQGRVTEEAKRVSAEGKRVAAEESRVSAESNRVTEFDKLKQSMQSAVQSSETATQATQTATTKASEATTKATDATTKATQATANATAATTKANDAAKLATDAASSLPNVDVLICSTPATTSAKVVTMPGFVLGSKTRLLIKMNNMADCENVTLTVNNSAGSAEAKPLMYNGRRASINNTWVAGDVLDVYYDGTNYQSSNWQGASGVTEINVSITAPKGGIDQSNKYTLSTALEKIADVPKSQQVVGFKCSFINDNGEVETAVYQGDTWEDVKSWYKVNNSDDRYVSTLGLDSFGFYLSQAEMDIVNASDSISVLAMAAPGNKSRNDWNRYLALFNTRNTNGVVAIDCCFDGKYKIFNNIVTKYMNGYKQLVSVNRVTGKVVFADELGLRAEICQEEFKQPNFMKDRVVQTYGGDNLGRFADYALFNFDFAHILAFNNEILEYMQGNNISGRLPQNLIQPNQDVTPIVYEKYKADTYGGYWDAPQQDEEGYYVYTTSTTGKQMQIKTTTSYNPRINQKAGCEEIVFEVLEGSVSHGQAEISLPVGKVRSIINISTGEEKKVGDELGVGVYRSTSDYWRRGIYHPYITAKQVPAKVRLISYSFKPYIAIAHLDCSRCYEGQNKVYDEIIGTTRQTTKNTKIAPYSIHLNASTFKKKTPDRAPRFVGERWYNTETGDIYEAGNFSAFKKITP